MIKTTLIFILLSLFLSSFACGGNGDGYQDVNSSSGEYLSLESTGKSSTNQDYTKTELKSDKKIIKEGYVTLEVGNIEQAHKDLLVLIEKHQGYSSRDNFYEQTERMEYDLTIKIPAENFEPFVNAVLAIAKKIDSKNITVQDVTEEFVDVEARLKVKYELEAKYKELLSKANSVEEIIKVEQELANIRAEIESFEGRLQVIRKNVAYSTLNLNMYKTLRTDYGFFSKFVDSIFRGWANLLDFIIILSNLWPFLIIIIAGILLRKKLKNKQKNA